MSRFMADEGRRFMTEGSFPFNITSGREALPEGFSWGRHHRGYLRWCAKRCSLSLPELAAACGWRKVEKFRRRRRQWHEGRGPVPRCYLETLGVDIGVLETCVELDLKEFEEILREPRFPDFFVARIMPATYLRVPLPAGTAEEEAIEAMLDHSESTGRSLRLHYLGLLTIAVEPGGAILRQTYPPELRVDRRSVSFGVHGDDGGVMRIG